MADRFFSIPAVEKAYTEVARIFSSRPFPDNALSSFQFGVNHTDPLVFMIAISIPLMFVIFVLNFVTGNYSHVDRLWSIYPVFSVIMFTKSAWSYVLKNGHVAHSYQLRSLVWCYLIIGWGLRLSYNFARKGGFNFTGEDPRWPEIRKLVHPIAFQIFNFTFISIIQIALLVGFATPVYISSLSTAPLNTLDYVAFGLFFMFFLGEIIADEQQWAFQTEKYRLIDAKQPRSGDYARGFLTKGLFAFSRHPNFFCEMSMWWCVYLGSVAATGKWLNWSIIGTLVLVSIFMGSTPFTEYLSAKKYPQYAEYQRKVSCLIPWFGKPMSSPKKTQ